MQFLKKIKFIRIGTGNETANDEVLQLLKSVIIKGWPDTKDNLPHQLLPYFHIRNELSELKSTMAGCKIVWETEGNGGKRKKNEV